MGTVKQRVPATINKNIPTGEVELVVEELRMLNESKQPPFLPGETVLPNEEMRLKYRYIDLRRDAMQFNIEMRHKVSKAIRDYLSAQGFFEIETPFMTRSTPEGARDYLVPSRVQPGSFYALPQSPQMFKQILMISGFDRYFQIVRCFRDEDLRADRQPEFTQIDLEMSYPQPEAYGRWWKDFWPLRSEDAGIDIKTPFPRMSYDEAMGRYGNDKPDLRLPAMVDVREALTPEEMEEMPRNSRSCAKSCQFSSSAFRKLETFPVPSGGRSEPTAPTSMRWAEFRAVDDRSQAFCQGLSRTVEKVLKVAEVEPEISGCWPAPSQTGNRGE